MARPKPRRQRPPKPKRLRKGDKSLPGDKILPGDKSLPAYKRKQKAKKAKKTRRWPRDPFDIEPLSDFMLVDPIERAAISDGGVAYSDSAVIRTGEALVIRTGPGYMQADGNRRPMQVRAGDRIVIDENTGRVFKVKGHKFLLIREAEVISTIPDNFDAGALVHSEVALQRTVAESVIQATTRKPEENA